MAELAESREVEVNGQLCSLESSISELEARIDNLVNRLSPVSRCVATVGAGNPSEVEQELVPIANTLRIEVTRVGRLVNAVNEAIDRLEI